MFLGCSNEDKEIKYKYDCNCVMQIWEYVGPFAYQLIDEVEVDCQDEITIGEVIELLPEGSDAYAVSCVDIVGYAYVIRETISK